MNSDQPVPRELKVLDTASLLEVEERACRLGLRQRLDPAWLRTNAAPEGTHHVWPVLWHNLSHRPDVPRQLRCELLISLRTGERVRSLLDVLPDDFTALPKATSRDEGIRAGRLLDDARTVREWLGGDGAVGHL
ncbi:hypothetical protein JCM4814A_49390 [Streptomyces phaeofaciens JCM 4814]|uniref:Uncharacterized protein n=1 Tax=Streptomyces phaeofaciens TaxID=68254 RepID=A0A918LP01_9ACTN|nr:hypothetical protein [Streptomyces phaeofaciens]GGT32610.1 hypothetical protein GCM10010226_06050 [Streptomyces phaeofaciens]